MILDLARRFGLYALLVLALGFLWMRYDAASDLAEARGKTIASLEEKVETRNTLIQTQNDAITALAKRREEGRVIYLKDYARADARAASSDARAAQLLAKQNARFTDELAECRAVRTLMQQELAQ